MRRVFSRPVYVLLAGTVTLIAFTLILIVHNIRLFAAAAALPQVSGEEFLRFAATFIFATTTSLPAIEVASIGLSALLIGITFTLGIFYIRLYRVAPSVAGSVGIAGAISALLGFGCAACGSLFLASLLGGSLGGVLVFLPLGGKEASLIGIALLSFAAYKLTSGINKPRTCPI